MVRLGAAAVVAAALLVLAATADPQRALTILAGAAFGFVLQRSRFCFASAFRDLFLLRDRRTALGLLAALAAGSAGYVVVMGARITDPGAGYLPQTAHIAPAGWHLLVGGAAFGLGMVLAGGCISGHLYRLGEGSLVAPVALLGSLGGFMLGLASWNTIYVKSVATAPVVWLPRTLGYGGALAVQLGAIAGLSGLLLWRFTALPPAPGEPATLRVALRRAFVDGWPTWIGGLAVGAIATIVYLRTSPLGVTSQIGLLARKLDRYWGPVLVPSRLEGLDQMAGCRPVFGDSLLTENGVLVLALVAGSLVASLLSGEFRLRVGRPRTHLLALAGGVLLGFGAMISLGCTVGTLLSGIMAFSLSGWVFALGLLGGAWSGGLILRKLA